MSSLQDHKTTRIAVVGSGPSGFYAVAALLKQQDHAVKVDLFDRLPTPYGLVRGGVAPDHQNIKNVIRVYEKVASHDSFRFFGNVKVGRDLSIDDLRRLYDQLVLAIGNESHRTMGIPGEDLPGVHSATEFVGWYNGHPDFSELEFPLARTRRVAVVGNGNVAMDVARVLAKKADSLASSDIADYALATLRSSTVKEILVLGRRGPAQAAFTTKEIKEIGQLEEAELVISPEEAALDPLSSSWLDEEGSAGAHKNVDYVRERSAATPRDCERRLLFRFLVSPVEFLADEGILGRVRLEKNELFEDEHGTPRPRGTGEQWVEEVDLAFTAVGYRGLPVPGLPFDERSGTLPNVEGRLVGEDGAHLPGLYAVGWAKRGPTGLIGSNVADSNETVAHMLEDIPSLASTETGARAESDVREELDAKSVCWFSFDDWRRLNEIEIARGQSDEKIRQKFYNVDDMISAVDKG